MAEEKETAEETFEVPLPSITEATIEENKKKMEETKAALTPPEGKELKGLRAFCSIHGDITNANMPLKYIRYFKNEKGELVPIPYSDIICKACLSDFWRKGVADKTFGQVVCAPIFGDPEVKEESKPEAEEKASE